MEHPSVKSLDERGDLGELGAHGHDNLLVGFGLDPVSYEFQFIGKHSLAMPKVIQRPGLTIHCVFVSICFLNLIVSRAAWELVPRACKIAGDFRHLAAYMVPTTRHGCFTSSVETTKMNYPEATEPPTSGIVIDQTPFLHQSLSFKWANVACLFNPTTRTLTCEEDERMESDPCLHVWLRSIFGGEQ
jgi:hypothetical protein